MLDTRTSSPHSLAPVAPRTASQAKPLFHLRIESPPSRFDLEHAGGIDCRIWSRDVIDRLKSTGQKTLRGPLVLALQIPAPATRADLTVIMDVIVGAVIEARIVRGSGSMRDVSVRLIRGSVATLSLFAFVASERVTH
jgi:hypothetical protein